MVTDVIQLRILDLDKPNCLSSSLTSPNKWGLCLMAIANSMMFFKT